MPSRREHIRMIVVILHYKYNWFVGFTKLYPTTSRVLTMFEVYRRNEEFPLGHTASEKPSEYVYYIYSDGISEAV